MFVRLSDKTPKTPFPSDAIGVGCRFVIKEDENSHSCTFPMVYECRNVTPMGGVGADGCVEIDGVSIGGDGIIVSVDSSEIIVVDIVSIDVEQKSIEYQGVSVDDISTATDILRKQECDGIDVSGVIDLLTQIAQEAKDAAQ